MGQVIAITGANGFVGRACVAEARRRGLPVLALHRSAPLPEWEGDDGISAHQLDLSDPGAADWLRGNLPPECALIHAAAHLGDDPKQLAVDTMQAMQSTMEGWRRGDIRMVLISSIAVYDTNALSPGDTLREASPLIALPDTPEGARDAYAGAKRMQETLLTHDDDAEDDWVLRVGAVWGPGRSWHALQGFWASKHFVTIGSDGELPLAHVDHVARTAVDAAQTYTDGVGVLNVFDDDRPTRARFLRAHRQAYGWPRLNLTVPYGLWLSVARLLKPVAKGLPGLFREDILRARMMPLRYASNLRSAFPGEDIDTFEGMMARTREAGE